VSIFDPEQIALANQSRAWADNVNIDRRMRGCATGLALLVERRQSMGIRIIPMECRAYFFNVAKDAPLPSKRPAVGLFADQETRLDAARPRHHQGLPARHIPRSTSGSIRVLHDMRQRIVSPNE